MLTKTLRKISNRLSALTQPSDLIQKEGLDYWREIIYSYMLQGLLVLGLFAAIPSIWLSFASGLSGLGIFDALAYLYVVALVFLRNTSYSVRALLLLLLGFSVGVVVFFSTGAGGAGLFWMFAVPPLASLLLGLGGGLFFLVLNTLFVIGTGFLLEMDLPTRTGLSGFSLASWVVYGVNFVTTNTLVTVPLGALFNGLVHSAQQEEKTKNFAERIIETSNAIFLQLDADGRVKRINETAEQVIGYTQAEIEGKSWFETLVPKEEYPHVWEEFLRIIRAKEIPDVFENPVLTKQGEQRQILWKTNQLIEDGKVVGIISFGIDITARKETEEKLHLAYRELDEAQRLNKIVLSSSPVGILVYEANSGKCVLANEAAQVLVGATKEQLLAQDFRHIESWKASGLLEKAKESLAVGEGQKLDTQFVTSFGKEVFLHCSFGLFMMGEEQHLLLSISDVSELNKAKDKMAQRLRELNAIHKVSSALAAATRLEDMLPHLLESTLDVMDLEAGSIWLYDEAKDEVRVNVLRGIVDEGGKEIHIPPEKPGEGLSGAVFASGQTHVSHDYSADARVPEEVRRRIPKGIGGVSVPIRSEEKALGVITVNTQLPHRVEETQVHLLATLAEIAGNAIQRTMLHQQTERGLQRLLVLNSIDRAIVSNFSLLPTLDVILQHVVAQLGVDASLVMLFNSATQTLESIAFRGFKTNLFEHRILHYGEGNAGRAAEERRVVYIQDLREQKDNPRLARALKQEDFISYFGLPLIAKGEVKGVLEVFHRKRLDPEQEWLDFLYTLAGQTAIAIDNAQLFEDLEKSNTELALAYDAAIEGWGRALDLRDKETEGHTQRVTDLTIRLANKMGVEGDELIHMRRGALLHDIGKMGIPDNILLKPEALTEEEWEVMKQHPVHAYNMLRPMSSLRKALDIPYAHHEKWDGSGYPRSLKGERIPLPARIFAVADVYDALTSDRPYRKAWTKADALKHIRKESGVHFDPQVARAFLSLIKGIE